MTSAILSLDTIGSKDLASRPGGHAALERLCADMAQYLLRVLRDFRSEESLEISPLEQEGDDLSYKLRASSLGELADVIVPCALAAFLDGPSGNKFRYTAYAVDADTRYQPRIGAFKRISKDEPGSAHHLAFDRHLVTALTDSRIASWLLDVPTTHATLQTPGEAFVGVIVDYYCPIGGTLQYAPPMFLRDARLRLNDPQAPVDASMPTNDPGVFTAPEQAPRTSRDPELKRLIDLGEIQLYRRMWADARHTFESGLRRAVELDSVLDRARMLANLGRVEASEQSPEGALSFYEQAMLIDRQCGSKRGEAIVLSLIGELFERTDPTRARDALANAVTIEEALGTSLSLVYVASTLGRVLRNTRDLEGASRMFEKAGRAAAATNHFNLAARYFGDQGSALRDLGRFEEAATVYLTSLKLSEASGLWYGIAITHDNLGRVRAMLGADHEAEIHFRRSLEIDRANGDSFGMGKSTANIALLVWMRGDAKSAFLLWKEASKLFENSLSRGGRIEIEARRNLGKLSRMRDALKSVKKGRLNSLFF